MGWTLVQCWRSCRVLLKAEGGRGRSGRVKEQEGQEELEAGTTVVTCTSLVAVVYRVYRNTPVPHYWIVSDTWSPKCTLAWCKRTALLLSPACPAICVV